MAAAAAIDDPRPRGAAAGAARPDHLYAKCGGHEFEAPTRFAKLFLGVGVETKREVSYEGTEHIGPEDMFDGDYGRLLEAVQNRGKGLASLSVPSWNQVLGWLKEMDTLRKATELAA